jgi:hypothetical protein
MQYQLELHSGIVRIREGFLYMQRRGNQRGDVPGDGERNATSRYAARAAKAVDLLYYRKQTEYEAKVQTNFELLAMI